MKGIITFCILLIVSESGQAQQNLSGILNRYTPVLQFICDSSVLIVGSASEFEIADKVLIIQMQGATISLNSDATFGNITNLGTCGNYEFNRIKSISNDHIYLQNKLTRPYDVEGKVQLVKVPEYSDAIVTNQVLGQPWNGNTGGIIALEVSGTLSLLSDINANDLGFRGGAVVDVNVSFYHETLYFYTNDFERSAAKGEGISIMSSDFNCGRGKVANGGGGGNAHNAGGGGGGNAGAGGDGGLEYYNTPGSPSLNTNGVGGLEILNQANHQVILGGGGGGGHTNDQVGTSGGNGGGMIFLRANTIIANGNTLKANGNSPDIITQNRNDGQGGGGAGGTILLDANEINGALFVEANGGNGADCIFHVFSQIIGPGGGGGGGKIITTSILPNTNLMVSGGLNGTANQGITNNAAPGKNGLILVENWWPESNILAGPTRTQSFTFCAGESVIINGQPYNQSGTILDTIPGTEGCDTIIIYDLHQTPFYPKNETIYLCYGDTLTLNNNLISEPATITDTILAGIGCDTLLTTKIEWFAQPMIDREIVLCEGTSIEIGGIRYDSEGIVTDTIRMPGEGCDSVRITQIKIENPPQFLPPDTVICLGDRLVFTSPYANTRWNGTFVGERFDVLESGPVYVFAFSENGCPLRDTLLVATCCSRQNVYVPNIFSPNDDGANDLFCINTIDRCRDFTLRIYDRWGSLLFVSKDADQCWDGRHQGKSMPSGVYTWFLEFYSDQFKRQDILKGSVTILR